MTDNRKTSLEDIEETIDKRWEQARNLLEGGDTAGSLFYLRALAGDGEPSAAREIGNIYHRGSGGVAPDPERAERWYRKSIDQFDDAYSCVGLSLLYRSGDLGEKDYSKSLHYLHLVEDNEIPEAHVLLGKHYDMGQGATEDWVRARTYYTRAAEAGNVVAKKNLAIMDIAEGQKLRGIVGYVRSVGRIFFLLLTDRHSRELFGLR